MGTTWSDTTARGRLDGVKVAAWSAAVAGSAAAWLGVALAALHLT